MTLVEQINQEIREQVVATVNGKPVTQAELNAAFTKVQNKENWKNPINAVVALEEGEEAMVREAVVFFTGCVPTFKRLKNGKVRVTGAGYYLTIGA